MHVVPCSVLCTCARCQQLLCLVSLGAWMQAGKAELIKRASKQLDAWGPLLLRFLKTEDEQAGVPAAHAPVPCLGHGAPCSARLVAGLQRGSSQPCCLDFLALSLSTSRVEASGMVGAETPGQAGGGASLTAKAGAGGAGADPGGVLQWGRLP